MLIEPNRVLLKAAQVFQINVILQSTRHAICAQLVDHDQKHIAVIVCCQISIPQQRRAVPHNYGRLDADVTTLAHPNKRGLVEIR